MNTFELDLDLNKRYTGEPVRIRQGDQMGTTIRASIYDHGTLVSGSFTCRYVQRIPSTDAEYYRTNATFTNGVAEVTIDETYAAAQSGETEAYFQLVVGTTSKRSTQSFPVIILEDATFEAEVGDKYDSEIEDAIAELDEAAGRIAILVQEETDRWLDEHPEITTTVQDNSLTDAKLIQHGGILDRVARLWHRLDNLLTATPAEADSLTVTDAAKTPLAGLALYGRSTQDGTPTPDAPVAIESVQGNLLDISESTLTPRQTIDTTTGQPKPATAGDWLAPLVDVEAASVTFVVSDTGTYGGSFNMACYKASGEFISWMALGRVTTTKELPSGTGKVRVYGYYGSGYAHVLSVTAALYAGYQGALPYVPYGYAGLWARGRNLLHHPYYYNSMTINGITWTVNEDGSVTANGTSTSSSYFILYNRANNDLRGLGAGTYTLSGSPSNAGTAIRFQYENDGGSSTTAQSTRGSSATITVGSQGLHVASGNNNFFLHVESNVTLNNVVFRPMLEYGSTAHEFAPYAESTTPIPLQGHALRSLPDGTRDEVTVDEYGHAVLVQRVFHVTLDGVTYKLNHNSGGYCSGNYSRMRTAPSSGAATWVQCDHFPRVVAAGGCYIANNMFVIRYGDGFNPTSQAELDAWFQANPTTFQFALADAQISYYDLGTIDPVALQGPDMTAQSVPTAPFALTYERDLNVTLARLEAAIADAATS